MRKPSIKVSFNSTTEFIDELRYIVSQSADASLLDRTLRVTTEYLPTAFSPSIRHVSVVATCIRQSGEVFELLELRRFCGDLWQIDNAQDEITRNKAKTVQEALTLAATELQLRVSAGWFQFTEQE